MFLAVTVAIITFMPVCWAGHHCPPQRELGPCYCWQESIDPTALSTSPFPSFPTTTPSTPHWRYSSTSDWRYTSKSDWRTSSKPDWRYTSQPDWRHSSEPDWRYTSQPDWRRSSVPDWRYSTQPDWNTATQTGWRYSTQPDWNTATQTDWRYSTKSDWNTATQTGWRYSTQPDWRYTSQPDWRRSSEPDWKHSSKPDWVTTTKSDWRYSSQPDWRYSSQPDWRYSSQPDWRYSSPPDWRSTTNNFFRGYLRTTVMCNAANSLIDLEKVMTLAFYRKTVDKLLLSRVPPKRDHTLSVLPSKWLRYTRVKMLEIQDTVLSGDFIALGEPFEGQEQSLFWITIKQCSLYGALTYDNSDTINTKGLNKLNHLEGLDMSYNRLTSVKNTAFRIPPANLTTLKLSYNSLKNLENTCFSYITNLKYVDLSHNILEKVTRGMFPSYAKLEQIDISWNMLKTIPSDFFDNMELLKVVKLEQNFLYSMPASPWISVWRNLEFVNLEGNFIHCDCDLHWLPFEIKWSWLRKGPIVLGNCTQDVFPDTQQHPISSLRIDQLAC